MFQPMLAVNTKVKDIRLPAYGSLKLEGVRGEFTPDGLLTRPMKTFGNDKWLSMKFQGLLDLAKASGVVIEGEFYKHGMNFSDISSICRRKNHPDTDQLEFHVFDIYVPKKPGMTFMERVHTMQDINWDAYDDVYRIEQYLYTDHSTIAKRYQEALENGYEGFVLKNPDEAYKTGRSTHREQKFLRIKQENTYDGVVLEIVEMMENLVESEENELGKLFKRQDKNMKAGKGMAAVAVTKCPDFDEPIRVTLSRGLTNKDREDIWTNKEHYEGKHIRFVGIPVEGMLPRAPRFDDWRTDLD